jgi:hypothetical protein
MDKLPPRQEGAKLSLSMAPVPKAKEATVTRPPPAAGFQEEDDEATTVRRVGEKRGGWRVYIPLLGAPGFRRVWVQGAG